MAACVYPDHNLNLVAIIYWRSVLFLNRNSSARLVKKAYRGNMAEKQAVCGDDVVVVSKA